MFFQNGQVVYGETNIATAAGTTNMSPTSTQIQNYTGSSTQTVVLPNATSCVVGQFWEIFNSSSGLLTLQYYGGASFSPSPTLSPGTSVIVKLVGNGSSAGTWAIVASASGASSGSGKNYLSAYTASTGGGAPNPGNGNFENSSTSGWSLANTTLNANLFPTSVATATNAFSASSGGSAASGNLSLSVVNSGQLAGSYSGDLASSAASVAGDMLISNAFNIDIEDQSKMMTIQFAFEAASGVSNLNMSGSSSNSFAIYIYDVTNAIWIQPSNVYGIAQVSGVGKTFAQFQASSNSTQYQLAIVNINASAGAYSLYVDDFSVGPQANSGYGAVMTDWTPYTMVITGSVSNPTIGTVSVNQAYWRRVGDSMEIFYELEQIGAGSAGSGDYLFSLPPGYTIDSTKVPLNDNSNIGIFYASTSGGPANGTGLVQIADSQHFYAGVNTNTSPAINTVGSTYYSLSASTVVYSLTAVVPILGWSSQSQIISQYDGRVVGLNANATSPGTFTSGATITGWGGPTQDTHGEFNATTGVYTIPVSGWYDVAAQLSANAGGGTTYGAIQLILAGSQAGTYTGPYANANTAVGVQSNISKTILLVAGDTIAIAGTWNGSSTQAVYLVNLSVNLISGAQQILAGQRIVAEYYLSATTGALSDHLRSPPFASPWKRWERPLSASWSTASTVCSKSAT